MEYAKAKGIVTALANGIDPTTGEVLPNTSPYNNPEIIRALFLISGTPGSGRQPRKTVEEKQQENLKAGRPRNTGLPWTEELKGEVAARFQSGASLEALSKHFERSRGAIAAELVKQGLMEPDETPPSRRPNR